MNSDTHITDEKQILASFISILPEAILMCDRNGDCLVHDRQSQAYLMAGETEAAEPVAMVGRPVTSFIDRHLIEHALDDIRTRLGQGMANPVAGFILEKHHRVLQTHVVPVLTRTGLFGGFVVIMSDITRQNQAEKRVESLLTTLSKNARSPMASIRAAVEAMKEFPGMEPDRQRQFIDIIHSESIVLSDILERVSQAYGRLTQAKKSLAPLAVSELMQTVSRRSRDRLGLRCRPDLPGEAVQIKADAYALISSLLFVLDRLKAETGSAEYHLSTRIKNQIVILDIAWQGEPVSTTLLHQWERMDIRIRNQTFGLSLKEILDQHQCAVWAYPGKGGASPFLRFFMPLDDTAEPAPLSPVSVLPEGRSQIREMEMFDHSENAMALDNRLMTELSYTALIREINQARGVEEIIGKHSQLPRLIHSMLSGGTKVRTITWLITAFSDAILTKLLSFALDELGQPPVPFAFITLGSEGRKEQTLKTDQDNAIIFRDNGDADWFLALGEKVCTWLDRAGYDFCQGGIMAKNPKWCRPLSSWKDYFSDWIHAPSPEDLLHTSIFFDLRFAFGDRQLVTDLIRHLHEQLSGWTGFFRNMAENAVYFKPPIGLFGRFQVAKKGPNKNCIDIKMANMPIVDFARIHSLKNGFSDTGTQDRLYRLYEKRVLSRRAYNELDQAYSFLIQLRFREQIQRILVEKTKARNHINPKHLSSIERQMLKQVLKQIASVQNRLSFEFIGGSDQQIS